MITCRELIEFIGAYLDGELRPGELDQFNRHMAVCPWCRDYLATYEETIRLGRGAFAEPESPVPDEVPEELVAAILAARS